MSFHFSSLFGSSHEFTLLATLQCLASKHSRLSQAFPSHDNTWQNHTKSLDRISTQETPVDMHRQHDPSRDSRLPIEVDYSSPIEYIVSINPTTKEKNQNMAPVRSPDMM